MLNTSVSKVSKTTDWVKTDCYVIVTTTARMGSAGDSPMNERPESPSESQGARTRAGVPEQEQEGTNEGPGSTDKGLGARTRG